MEFVLKPREKPNKFLIVGLIENTGFQKCRYFINKLHLYFPLLYAQAEIRGMLNLDWDNFITKMRQRYGKDFYLIKNPVTVWLNGIFLGDDKTLSDYIFSKYNFVVDMDFEQIANEELIQYFSNIIYNKGRRFVYLTISIDNKVIGSLLFLLYTDICPVTCHNFLTRCKEPLNGYRSTKIHRIVTNSWIQCGGFHLSDQPIPCENYAISHDRRGVLSMCNVRKHTDNNTQFFITLNPTQWMDYNYVAFGQLVQGNEVLSIIEEVPTYYENPLNLIRISNCGEFTLCPDKDEDFVSKLNTGEFRRTSSNVTLNTENPSVLTMKNYNSGKYCLSTDLQQYLPYMGLPGYYLKYLDDLSKQRAPAEEQTVEKKDNDVIVPFVNQSSNFYFSV